MQLQPHFLLNTLNAIAALMHKDLRLATACSRGWANSCGDARQSSRPGSDAAAGVGLLAAATWKSSRPGWARG